MLKTKLSDKNFEKYEIGGNKMREQLEQHVDELDEELKKVNARLYVDENTVRFDGAWDGKAHYSIVNIFSREKVIIIGQGSVSDEEWQAIPHELVLSIVKEWQEEFKNSKNSIDELTESIKKWAIDRELHNGDYRGQFIKLGEEFGELANGLAKNKQGVIKDSLGDMYVVMTILAMQLGLDITECISAAYEEIKNRKGKMVDGIFIKEDDL